MCQNVDQSIGSSVNAGAESPPTEHLFINIALQVSHVVDCRFRHVVTDIAVYTALHGIASFIHSFIRHHRHYIPPRIYSNVICNLCRTCSKKFLYQVA